MNTKKPIQSLVTSTIELKKGAEKSGAEFKEHIMFGVEVDADGNPEAVLSSIDSGGYMGLGMIDALQMMLDTAREDIATGFMNVLKDNKVFTNKESKSEEHAEMDISVGVEDPKMVPREAMEKIIRKYDERIADAARDKDFKELDRLKSLIIDDVRKQFPDYTGDFRIGVANTETGEVYPMGGDSFPPPNFKGKIKDIKDIKDINKGFDADDAASYS